MAAKIKDGLFIGDVDTSQDAEFLELNKISNLINLSGRESPNVWASHGLVYLTLNWEDRPDFVLFPERERNDILDDLCEFVDVSLQHGISVLMFSTRGEGRCVVAAIAYLMCKYCWGLDKTMEYARSKKPDIELNRGFMQQLHKLDKHLQKLRLHLYGSLYTEYEESIRMRLKEWNPAYLDKPHPGSILSGEVYDNKSLSIRSTGATTRKRRGGVGLHCDAEEEALLINSFVNSKQYISQLPGPFSHAETMSRKVNKLRFNPQEREYELENRERPQRKAVIVGLLKGSRAKHQAAMREQEEAKARAAQAQSQAQQQHARDSHRDRDSNNRDGNGSNARSRDRDRDRDDYSVDEEAADDNASDNVSDVSDPVSPMGGFDSARSNSNNNNSNSNSNNNSSSHSSAKQPMRQGYHSNSATLEDFPGSTVSNASVGSTDLYYFVGLGGSGTGSANASVASNHPDSASSQAQNQSQAGRGYSSAGPNKSSGPASVRDSLTLKHGSMRRADGQGQGQGQEYSERDQRDHRDTRDSRADSRDAKGIAPSVSAQSQRQMFSASQGQQQQQQLLSQQQQQQPPRVARPASPSAAMQYQHAQQANAAAQGKSHPHVNNGQDSLRRQVYADTGSGADEKPYRGQPPQQQQQQLRGPAGPGSGMYGSEAKYSDMGGGGYAKESDDRMQQQQQQQQQYVQGNVHRQTPSRGSTPSRGDPRASSLRDSHNGSTDNMTLHEIASMTVDPTPLSRSSKDSLSQSQSQSYNQGQSAPQVPSRGGGMSQFQGGGPVRVHRTGPSGGSRDMDRPQQRAAWNDSTAGPAPIAGGPGQRASTPTRTVPGRQFGNPDPHANFDAGQAQVQAQMSSNRGQPYMNPPQRKTSSSSIGSNTNDDNDSYGSSRSNRIPGDYNSLHNRVAPQRPNINTAAGSSGTQPRVYRHGSPAPNKARQVPTAGGAGTSRMGGGTGMSTGSSSMYAQRPSSASRAYDNPDMSSQQQHQQQHQQQYGSRPSSADRNGPQMGSSSVGVGAPRRMPSPTPQVRKSTGGIAQSGGSTSSRDGASALAYSTYTMDPNGLPGDRVSNRAQAYTMRGSSPARGGSMNPGQYGSGQLPPADNYSNSYRDPQANNADNRTGISYNNRPSSGTNSRYGTPTRQQMPVWR